MSKETEARWKRDNRERHLASMRAWREEHKNDPELIAARKRTSKEWYEKKKNDPEFRKRRIQNTIRYFRTEKGKLSKFKAKLMHTFGLPFEEYERLLKEQGNVCAICKQSQKSLRQNSRPISRLAIDHDHVTGKVRGLLCQNCNHGLGKFLDSIDLLQAAITYLQKTS